MKTRIDETDPNNVYIWTIKTKDDIRDIDKAIRHIEKISKIWSETLTGQKVDWVDRTNLIWDNRATYTYY
jgi:hypothetical protein